MTSKSSPALPGTPPKRTTTAKAHGIHAILAHGANRGYKTHMPSQRWNPCRDQLEKAGCVVLLRRPDIGWAPGCCAVTDLRACKGLRAFAEGLSAPLCSA